MECEYFRILLKLVSNHLSLLFQFACLKLKKPEKKKNGNLLWNELKKHIFLKKCFLNHVPWVPAFVEKACLIISSRLDKVLVIKHQVKMIMAWNFEKSRTEELQVELNKMNFILYSQFIYCLIWHLFRTIRLIKYE